MRILAGRRSTRVVWGLLDEVLSSVTNVVVTVLAARALTGTQFGLFALVVVGTQVVVVVGRGLASDPLAAAHSADDPVAQRVAIRAGAGVAVSAGVLFSIPALILLLTLGGGRAASVAVLLPFFVGLLLQDYVRFALIVQGRPRDAFLNDLLWLAIQAPLLVALGAQGTGSLALLAAWSGSGALAGLVGLLQLRLVPARPAGAAQWLRRHRRLWPYLLFDNGLGQASVVGGLVALSAVASLAQIGGFRVASTAFAPLLVLSRGLVGVVVPEIARARLGGAGVRRAALSIGLAQLPVAAAWTLGLVLLPERAGRALFGEAWLVADHYVAIMSVSITGVLLINAVTIALRGVGAGQGGFVARVGATAVSVVAGVVGAVVDGAYGMLVAWAVVAPVQVGIWWLLLVRQTAGQPEVQAPLSASRAGETSAPGRRRP